MPKINNDKYYTEEKLAKKLIQKTFEILGQKNISEIIEPSAGDGSFSKNINECRAYDIEPEHKNIIKANFLKLDLDYKKNRLFIGNPPFGSRMSLARKFYKKCCKNGDYIAFILPISQLNNSNSLFQFDLIHSEDLGLQQYSNRKLHCCFNIYKRPQNGKLNKRNLKKLKAIKIYRQDSKSYDSITNYDIRMCYWGNGSAGKILSTNENYAGEYKIVINDLDKKDEIIKVLKNVDWHQELNKIAELKIQQFHIYQILRKYIEGIK